MFSLQLAGPGLGMVLRLPVTSPGPRNYTVHVLSAGCRCPTGLIAEVDAKGGDDLCYYS